MTVILAEAELSPKTTLAKYTPEASPPVSMPTDMVPSISPWNGRATILPDRSNTSTETVPLPVTTSAPPEVIGLGQEMESGTGPPGPSPPKALTMLP